MTYVVVVAVVYTLAVARLVRLVNHDVVFDPVRLWVAGHAAAAGRFADQREGIEGFERDAARWRGRQGRWNTAVYYLGCPWCVSVWVAAATAWIPLWHSGNPVAVYGGVVLAVSHVVGLGARWASDGEELEIVDAADVA